MVAVVVVVRRCLVPPSASAGVALAIRKDRARACDFIELFTPEAESSLLGCGGGAPIRCYGLFDIVIFTFYLAPGSRKLNDRHTTMAVLQWLRAQLATLPARTIPILLGDANGYLASCADGRCVGPYCDFCSSWNGLQLCDLMEEFELMASKTWTSSGSGATW